MKTLFTCTLCIVATATLGASCPETGTDANLYMVVDLSGGAEAEKFPVRFSATGPDLENDACRTTELWLRLIAPGTFMMGSPETEIGRSPNETQHEVTITRPFYIGVFEVTQRQWQLVTGKSAAYHAGDMRPVESVFYADIRGRKSGAGWPTSGSVDDDSFLGRMRAKTAAPFDLPTEAQWEYACRAGTTTALNNGRNLGCAAHDAAMSDTGRYDNIDQSDGRGGYSSAHTKVGCYAPNAWGLYDMHGNVFEWCLDWFGLYHGGAEKDPVGCPSGDCRVLRGGSFRNFAQCCRSAYRHFYYAPADGDSSTGFRLCCPAAW